MAKAAEQLAPQPHVIVVELGDVPLALGPLVGVHLGLEGAGVGVQAHDVAVAQLGERPAIQRFGA